MREIQDYIKPRMFNKKTTRKRIINKAQSYLEYINKSKDLFVLCNENITFSSKSYSIFNFTHQELMDFFEKELITDDKSELYKTIIKEHYEKMMGSSEWNSNTVLNILSNEEQEELESGLPNTDLTQTRSWVEEKFDNEKKSNIDNNNGTNDFMYDYVFGMSNALSVSAFLYDLYENNKINQLSAEEWTILEKALQKHFVISVNDSIYINYSVDGFDNNFFKELHINNGNTNQPRVSYSSINQKQDKDFISLLEYMDMYKSLIKYFVKSDFFKEHIKQYGNIFIDRKETISRLKEILDKDWYVITKIKGMNRNLMVNPIHQFNTIFSTYREFFYDLLLTKFCEHMIDNHRRNIYLINMNINQTSVISFNSNKKDDSENSYNNDDVKNDLAPFNYIFRKAIDMYELRKNLSGNSYSDVTELLAKSEQYYKIEDEFSTFDSELVEAIEHNYEVVDLMFFMNDIKNKVNVYKKIPDNSIEKLNEIKDYLRSNNIIRNIKVRYEMKKTQTNNCGMLLSFVFSNFNTNKRQNNDELQLKQFIELYKNKYYQTVDMKFRIGCPFFMAVPCFSDIKKRFNHFNKSGNPDMNAMLDDGSKSVDYMLDPLYTYLKYHQNNRIWEYYSMVETTDKKFLNMLKLYDIIPDTISISITDIDNVYDLVIKDQCFG